MIQLGRRRKYVTMVFAPRRLSRRWNGSVVADSLLNVLGPKSVCGSGWILSCCIAAVAIGFDGGTTQDAPPAERAQLPVDGRESSESQSDEDAGAAVLSEPEVRKLIMQLDAARFDARNLATRQLVEQGCVIVPFLIDSLDQPSREIRFRCGELLRQNFSFSEVAPHLVKVLMRQPDSPARGILAERASWQVQSASESPSTEQLLKFWGTSVQAFRLNVLSELEEAKTGVDTAKAVRPLIGLSEKAARFQLAMGRLDALGLPYGHQYSSGFLIARTLAKSLNHDEQTGTQFADSYLTALESLVRDLRSQEKPPHAIKAEVIDRANYSRGAASFLVQLMDGESPQAVVLSERIKFPREKLMDAFVRGLASTERQRCFRDVGKVHIIDMLTESVSRWSMDPTSPIITKLISNVTQTAETGEKPKALAYLDALDACWELPNHGLKIDEGVGQQYCRRLLAAAERAKDNRSYHPSRAMYDKFIVLADRQVLPGHWAFPTELFTRFMQGNEAVVADEQRLALERYLRILEQIDESGIDRESAGAKRFIGAMRDAIIADMSHLTSGLAELGRLKKEYSMSDDFGAVDAAMDEWVRENTTSRKDT